MTMRHRLRSGSARRGFATITSAALLLSMMAVPASAEHFENTEVLDADNAVEASVNWSQFTFDEATDVALGRNDKFPDNLASAVIQGTLDAPLLLTDGDALSEEIAEELERLGAETVHALGGEAALSEDVIDELEGLGYEVHRHAGATRIETAIEIAEDHAGDATEGLVVRAFGDAGGDETRAWADALAAGGWAAEEEIPVFLTQTEELNDNLKAYLEDSAIESLTIIGGNSAVSAAVETELEAMGIDVDRVSGVNRFATAVAVAAARGFGDAGDADEVILSEGQQSDAWAGGFTAAAYSAMSGSPIVLSNGETIPPETEEFLEGAGGDGSVALVCGPFVEPEACDEAATILGQEEAAHTNQAFTATPAETAVNTVSAASPNENRGSRQYTVNVGDATQVDIQLFEASFVTTDGDGNVSFRDTDSNNVADAGAPVGSIAVVNGAGTSGTRVNNVTPINGQVTFTINSTTAGSVVPVVYADTDGDNALDLVVATPANANPKQPSEEFGIGGQKTWVPEEAQTGALAADEGVTSVNKDLDFIVANGKTYNYDANDVFQIATANAVGGVDEVSTCTNTTLSNFETQLSAGDELDRSTNYTREEAASSTFCLEDVSPAVPQTVAAAAQDADTIRVTWTAPTTGAPDNYRVYRLQTAAACPTTLASYTLVTTVSGTTLQYDDNGLAANTRYCYVVTAVQNGDESAIGGPVSDTTSEAGATVQPQSTDAYVAVDTNFPGVVSTGDEWRIVFDKVMQTPDGTDTIIVQDTQGDRFDVICDGTVADCRLNTAAVTIDGVSYPAGRVLTVVLVAGTGIIPADSTPSGSMNDQLEYPATITTQNGFVDLAGNAWTPADDPDRVIDQEAGKAETGTFTADAAAPTLASASGSGNALTTTWSEGVTGVDATDFVVYATGDNTCAGAASATGTAFTSNNGDPTLGTTLNTTLAAGAYFVRVAAGGVQDFQDNANAQTACTAVTFS